MKKTSINKIGLLGVLVPLSFIPKPANAMLTIAITATVELNFGTMDVAGAGTVVMNTTNGRSVTGGVTAITGAGLESSGVLSISGSTGLAIDLSMTAASYSVSNGGGATMAVNNFNLVTNAGGATETITLTSNPTNFPFGATLNVGAGQAAGTYTGTFTVNANYQ
jgi:hypothetical protein